MSTIQIFKDGRFINQASMEIPISRTVYAALVSLYNNGSTLFKDNDAAQLFRSGVKEIYTTSQKTDRQTDAGGSHKSGNAVDVVVSPAYLMPVVAAFIVSGLPVDTFLGTKKNNGALNRHIHVQYGSNTTGAEIPIGENKWSVVNIGTTTDKYTIDAAELFRLYAWDFLIIKSEKIAYADSVERLLNPKIGKVTNPDYTDYINAVVKTNDTLDTAGSVIKNAAGFIGENWKALAITGAVCWVGYKLIDAGIFEKYLEKKPKKKALPAK